MRRIGAGKGRPEEVIQGSTQESAVVTEHDERDARKVKAFQVLRQALAILISRCASEGRPLDRQHARQGEGRLGETLGQGEIRRQRCGQLPLFIAAASHDDFRAGIPTLARVVEGVDGGFSLKVQVALPVHPLQHVAEEGADIVGRQVRYVAGGGDNEEFSQRSLP